MEEPLWVYRLHEQSLAWDKAAIIRARQAILERVLERDDLTAGERASAQETLAPLHRDALLVETEAALAERRPEARRLALELLRTPGVSARGRAKALAAAAAPRLAGRLLARSGPSPRTARKDFSQSG